MNNSFSYGPLACGILYHIWVNNFTSAGNETLTINGSVYECDKYREIGKSPGQTYLVWIDPDIPVPVKVGVEEDTRWSSELAGWG